MHIVVARSERRKGHKVSRCKRFNRKFAEENGWQEFCSLQCACEYVAGKRIDDIDRKNKNKDLELCERWRNWIFDEKNRRTVRLRARPEPAPTVGRFEDRVVEWADKNGKKFRKAIRVNVGSEVTVRPMTDEERASVERYRGHGFSDGHARNPSCDDLPSVHGLVGMGWYPHD